MLTIPEKLYLLPPKPAQGFTYWLRQNSLSHTQHDSHKSPGLCQQLVLVLEGLQCSLASCICSLSIPSLVPWDILHHQLQSLFTAALAVSLLGGICVFMEGYFI